MAIDTSVLEPGFVVSGAARRTVLVPPRGAARADFEIVRYVALAGSVVRCVAGEVRPIAGARLALLSDSFVQTATSSSSGSFEIDSIPPGSYQIVIDPASVPDVLPSSIPRLEIDLTTDRLGYVVGLECDGGGTVAVPPAPQPAGAVTGTVTLNDAPVIGAEILLDGRPATRTRTDGTFVLEAPAGERFISVRLPAAGASAIQGEANRRIEVIAGRREELRFDFRGSAQLTGRVTVCRGGAEVPVPDAGVYLLGGRHAEARTDVDGVFTLSGVTPGRYLLILDREALLAAGAAAGDIPRLVVDLRGDQALEIRVCGHRPDAAR